MIDPATAVEPDAGRRRRGGGTGAPPLWFGLPFLLGGLLIVVFGLGVLRDELRLRDEGVTVAGTVTGKTISRGDNSDIYRLEYEFRVADGSGSVQRGSASVSQATYRSIDLGGQARVTYLPDDPAKNRLGTAEVQLSQPLVLLASGGLFALVGVAVLATSLRARRKASINLTAPATGRASEAGVSTPITAAERARVDTFTRSPFGAVAELVLLPLGGIGFLAVAIFLLGQVGSDPFGILGVPVFGFFGLLLLASIPWVLRRGIGLAMVKVGPDGIWQRGVGLLGWDEIAELRIEHNRGSGGSDRSTMVYDRLGIVPRDPARAERVAGGIARRMAGAFIRFANRLARGRLRMTEVEEMAALGVSAYELEQPFDEVLASVRRFAHVEEAVAPPATGGVSEYERTEYEDRYRVVEED